MKRRSFNLATMTINYISQIIPTSNTNRDFAILKTPVTIIFDKIRRWGKPLMWVNFLGWENQINEGRKREAYSTEKDKFNLWVMMEDSRRYPQRLIPKKQVITVSHYTCSTLQLGDFTAVISPLCTYSHIWLAAVKICCSSRSPSLTISKIEKARIRIPISELQDNFESPKMRREKTTWIMACTLSTKTLVSII